MSKLQVQIKDLPEYSSWLSSVNAGTYKLKIRATADNYLPSDYTALSDTITYKVFSITPTLNNITTTQTLRKVGEDYTEDIIFNLSANGTAYTVPVTAPTVTGATGTYTRSSNTSASLKLTNITSNVSFTVTADGALTAPTISISGNTLLITDNSGKTGNSYEIYVNDSLKLTATSTSVMMDSLNLGVGTHTIKVKAKNTNYITSAFSNSATWKVYSITPTLTGLTASTSNVSAVAQSISSVTLEYSTETGYITPSTAPTVTNATVEYNRVSDSQCTLVLTNITGNITFTLTAIKRLDTPTNVTVSDAYVVEFDKVENATNYDVLVDGTIIGNYKAATPSNGYKVTFASNFSYGNGSGYSPSPSISSDTGYSIDLSASSTPGTVWENVTTLTIGGDTNDSAEYVYYTMNGADEIWYCDTNSTLSLTGDIIITSANFFCLTGDTLITLADGTQKRIDELTLSDKVLSYNPSTMQLEADEITYTDSKEDKSFTEYTRYIFSDNTEIKTVHRHRFYNMERQAMAYMDEWKIGEHAIKQDGTVVELISLELIKEIVKHYTIFTKNQNYFANGLLSGNRHTESMHFEAVD